jgi:hypothetical protein
MTDAVVEAFHVEQPLGYPQVVRFTWNTQIVDWGQSPQAVKSFHVKRIARAAAPH